MVTPTYRFRSPFKHWLAGLLTEVTAFLAYIAVLATIIWVAVLIERAL